MTRVGQRADAARAIALLALCATGCSTHQHAEPRTGESAPLFASSTASPMDPALTGPAPANAARQPASGPPSAPPGARGVPIQRGRATYYSDRFTGRPTANGEPYDPRALTAAHRTLPFGAVVDVVRRDGRRVRVRINDRGPFARGKIIDLSRRAAEDIGLVSEGTCDVTIELVSRPPRRR